MPTHHKSIVTIYYAPPSIRLFGRQDSVKVIVCDIAKATFRFCPLQLHVAQTPHRYSDEAAMVELSGAALRAASANFTMYASLPDAA